MNAATVLLEYTFLSFQKKGCSADGLKLSPFLIMLPHYGRTGAGSVFLERTLSSRFHDTWSN